jgi:hypothetical protein
MTTATKEKPHVWTHPRDRLVLGVKLSEVKAEVDKELIRSLAREKSTAPVWLVFQKIGATDRQIDDVLRFPGPRVEHRDNRTGQECVHWHWRTTFQSRGETQFWLRSKLQLSGPELVACVRRLLQIPELQPSTAAADAGTKPKPAGMSEADYAALARGAMELATEPCRGCGGAGEIDWVCDECEGTGRDCARPGSTCHWCSGSGGGAYPCERCASIEARPFDVAQGPDGEDDQDLEPDPEPALEQIPAKAPAEHHEIPRWAPFNPEAVAASFEYWCAKQVEEIAPTARGTWFIMGMIEDGAAELPSADAETLAEGLAGREAAETWLRGHHREMSAAHGYDCFFVDGATDDAAWNAAERWSYSEAGSLVSDRDGRVL